MPREQQPVFPLPRRGEVRYALARAAAILSSLLLLLSVAAATPLTSEPSLAEATVVGEEDAIIFPSPAPSELIPLPPSVAPSIPPTPSASAAPAWTRDHHVHIDAQELRPAPGAESVSPPSPLEPITVQLPPSPTDSAPAEGPVVVDPPPPTPAAPPSGPPAPSASATASATASPSAPSSAAPPAPTVDSSGVQTLPAPAAGQNIVVFPIKLRVEGQRGVSRALDACIRSLAAKRTETSPADWALVGVRGGGGSAPEIEARYAVSFSKGNTEGVSEFEAYVNQSMARDIARNCNILDVEIVGAAGSIIAAVGAKPSTAEGTDRRIALAASLGGLALLAFVGGVFALLYARRRRHPEDDIEYGIYTHDGSSSMSGSHDRAPPPPPAHPPRRGLRFSSSRETGPGPHTIAEAMDRSPIYEISMSDEGETITTRTITGLGDSADTSIYDEDDTSREFDPEREGPSNHSLQTFSGTWGGTSSGARQVSEPDLDDEDSGPVPDVPHTHGPDTGFLYTAGMNPLVVSDGGDWLVFDEEVADADGAAADAQEAAAGAASDLSSDSPSSSASDASTGGGLNDASSAASLGSSSADAFGDGGFPEPPSSNSVNTFATAPIPESPRAPAPAATPPPSAPTPPPAPTPPSAPTPPRAGHPHDYQIGVGPTTADTPLPADDYVVPRVGDRD